jgi:hypothetical protein
MENDVLVFPEKAVSSHTFDWGGGENRGEKKHDILNDLSCSKII